MLEECYDQVDGISLHNYYGNTPQLTGNNTSRYLAMNLDMERQIHEIAAVCDYVQGAAEVAEAAVAVVRRMERLVSRPRRRFRQRPAASSRRICWRSRTTWKTRCSVGGFVNTLLRQSDRVRVGCLAQIVNVIAPLMTNEDERAAAIRFIIRTRGR